ncbi:hypothetical protein PR202_gb00057 [Eleusine coracana subsp. coracana]|uniref:Uncharacterized protein n=1 Tax=Eleusine coracana subsp. coracana TaxID=191504 RepID=A0AAV5DQZ9_ELECO|nr:hypothetical protein PR202_gb00057 [Eleusine coracana subsp. coracana]
MGTTVEGLSAIGNQIRDGGGDGLDLGGRAVVLAICRFKSTPLASPPTGDEGNGNALPHSGSVGERTPRSHDGR